MVATPTSHIKQSAEKYAQGQRLFASQINKVFNLQDFILTRIAYFHPVNAAVCQTVFL